MTTRPHVALLIESTSAYGRGLLAGIAAYVREHQPWAIYWQERSLEDAPPSWLRGWKGHGLIARIATPPFARALRATGLPVVNLYRWLPNLDLPGIYPDNAALTRLAAEHLLQRGFRHFAYCGFAATGYSDERARMFARWIEQAGYPCPSYQPPGGRRPSRPVYLQREGLLNEAHLTRWLRQQPKPLGLLTCNDLCGQQVLTTCREIGLAVPDEAAVLGVDNNELLCKLADPPLSSVDPNCERIGYEAAALLARLMTGEPSPAASLLVEPRGIVTRRSTDVLAVEDADLAEALRFIRRRAPEGLTVHELLKSCSLSCSTLERRFVRLLGHSPQDEIIQVKLQRVMELLAETNLSLAAIAARTGFKYTEYLCTVFKKKMGLTPGQYRLQIMGRRSR